MIIKKTLSLLILMCLIVLPANAQSIGTRAEHAILIDTATGDVLFEKDADTPFPPASMSKLMTVYMAFDALRNGDLQLSDEVKVSAEAWRKWRLKGSTMFLNAGETVTIEQLLLGIIVLSGNDACVVLAEHMAGGEGLFAEWMNAKAQTIGLTNSHFMNSNGWPAEGHVMTARDLGILSTKLATEFPELYSMFAIQEFQYKDYDRNRFNRNPLLGRLAGADGLKTGGLPDQNKYGIAGSAVREGRRLVLVLGGLPSVSARRAESQRLIQYGFRNFKYYPLFKAGERVDFADVWLGKSPTVPLVISEDLLLTLSRKQRSQMKVSVTYNNPVQAPIAKGQEIGQLIVNAPDMRDISVPLLAGEDVDNVGGLGKIGAALSYLIFGSAGAN